MSVYDVVIIGSGLGGLQCGFILSKLGMKVCIVEKNSALGGCLQSFKRGANEFDTGFHYIGSLDKGQILYKIFDYMGLMNLQWQKLDSSGFDEIFYNGKSYLFENGYENFANRIISYFPLQKEGIERYVSLLKSVGDNIIAPLFSHNENPLFDINAFSQISSILKDTDLVNVVSGNSLKLELNKATLPIYTFSQINSSFIQSAYRLVGGGSQIADLLASKIMNMGGNVITNCKGINLVEESGVAKYLEVDNADIERIYSKSFISNLSPELTLDLLSESKSIRPIFRKRISALEQTFGMFTVNIALKPNKITYLNRNIYYYENGVSPWDVVNLDQTPKGVLISYQVPKTEGGNIIPKYTNVIDILTPMSFSQVSKWSNTQVGRRGEDYKEFKAKKAEECINLAQRVIPNLKESIDSISCSTPLTYRNYTGAIRGTAYGIRKDCNNSLQTLIAPKSPISNLYFTGQNLNLHGVLGVSMTSLLTCSAIVGREKVVSFLKD